jgi:hypothetical protein
MLLFAGLDSTLASICWKIAALGGAGEIEPDWQAINGRIIGRALCPPSSPMPSTQWPGSLIQGSGSCNAIDVLSFLYAAALLLLARSRAS